MVRRIAPFAALLALVAAGLWLALSGESPDVVCYASVDDEVVRPMLERFRAETGLRVKVEVDTEATKSIGMANRLLKEGRPGARPRADVYWNNEPAWTVRLADAGVLEPYDSPAARDIPAAFRDPAGLWVANGARARVLIAHSPSVAAARPSSYLDLADPRFKDRAAIARPLAGTTLTHLAALRSLVGAAEFERWLRGAAGNGVAFASGNGSLAREVGRGARAFGFTDTDDFAARRAAGESVEAVFPDQGEGQVGTFVLPVTVALVRGGPHPEAARRLYDWLVSPATEAALSASSYATIPVRPGTPPGPQAVAPATFRAAKVDWREASKHVDAVLDLARSILESK